MRRQPAFRLEATAGAARVVAPYACLMPSTGTWSSIDVFIGANTGHKTEPRQAFLSP